MFITHDKKFAVDADSYQFILSRQTFDKDGNPSGYGRRSYHATLRAVFDRMLRDRMMDGIKGLDDETNELLKVLQRAVDLHEQTISEFKAAMMTNGDVRDRLQEEEE